MTRVLVTDFGDWLSKRCLFTQNGFGQAIVSPPWLLVRLGQEWPTAQEEEDGKDDRNLFTTFKVQYRLLFLLTQIIIIIGISNVLPMGIMMPTDVFSGTHLLLLQSASSQKERASPSFLHPSFLQWYSFTGPKG